jgi:hypothetical protein
MNFVKFLAVAAVMSGAMVSGAHAQTANNQGGASYPASMAGVVMANVPVSDICQLNNNPGLTPAGQALVAAEIQSRPVTCPAGALLPVTNAAFLIPVGATLLLAALAGGGDSGSTNNTQ